VAQLAERPWTELHLIEVESGEIHEEEAGERIARAACGLGVRVGALGGGHWPLVADTRGVLCVAIDALQAVNQIEGACVYTRYDSQVVEAGSVVARAKITPFVIAADAVRRAEHISSECGGLVRVAPFRSQRVGLVVQETLEARAAERLQSALASKLSWFGCSLLPPITVAPNERPIHDAFAMLGASGAEIMLIAGTKSLDPLDPAFSALRALGIQLDRYGVPVHPGSLLWIGRWGERPVMGLPTCGLFGQLTSFDRVFPRLVAGLPTDSAALAALAHGGLLAREVSFFPPYDN
jgi:hypothetical protein